MFSGSTNASLSLSLLLSHSAGDSGFPFRTIPNSSLAADNSIVARDEAEPTVVLAAVGTCTDVVVANR